MAKARNLAANVHTHRSIFLTFSKEEFRIIREACHRIENKPLHEYCAQAILKAARKALRGEKASLKKARLT